MTFDPKMPQGILMSSETNVNVNYKEFKEKFSWKFSSLFWEPFFCLEFHNNDFVFKKLVIVLLQNCHDTIILV